MNEREGRISRSFAHLMRHNQSGERSSLSPSILPIAMKQHGSRGSDVEREREGGRGRVTDRGSIVGVTDLVGSPLLFRGKQPDTAPHVVL